MNTEKSVPSAVTIVKPDQSVQDDKDVPLTDWYGTFTSKKLGSFMLKGFIKAKAKDPLACKQPYVAKIQIHYLGLVFKGTVVEVEALITPAGQMYVQVNDRRIVFQAVDRTRTKAVGNYRVVEGPYKDSGDFFMYKGECPKDYVGSS